MQIAFVQFESKLKPNKLSKIITKNFYLENFNLNKI